MTERAPDEDDAQRAAPSDDDARSARPLVPGDARAQLAFLVEHLPVVIYTCDERDFHTTYVSANVHEITGFTADDLYRAPLLWLERIHPDDRAVALVSSAALERVPYREVEYRWQHADGRWVWFLDVVRLVRSESGGPSHHAGVLLDVTERRRAEDELRASREEARRLTRSLFTVREEEQRRLSRDLHDALGQCLTTLRLAVGHLVTRHGRDDAQLAHRLRGLDADIDAAEACMRDIARRLRPTQLDDLGLAAALDDLAAQFRERAQLDVTLAVHVDCAILDDARSIAVYRIAQEALTNVVRHARARAVDVRVEHHGPHLCLVVEDDGIGLAAHADAHPPGAEEGTRAAPSDGSAPSTGASSGGRLGLAGMRERTRALGGCVEIGPRAGGGTRVEATIPMADGVGGV